MANNDSNAESNYSTTHSQAEIENYPHPTPLVNDDSGPQVPPHPLDDHIAALTAKLNSFSAQAQAVLAKQPLKTQRKLTKATGEIFKKYQKHGVSARLHVNLGEFLTGRDGKGKKMELELAQEDDSDMWSQISSAGGWSDGHDQAVDDSESEVVPWKGKGRARATSSPPRRSPTQIFLDDINEVMENWGRDQGFSVPAVPNPLPFAHGAIVDEESRNLADPAKLPFHPIDTLVSYPANTKDLPEGMLQVFDHIYGLYALEAHALLKHHTAKYGAHPIFRAGIRELMQSQLEYLFVPTAHHDTGLTHETRTFLRSVFERHSGELNLAEKRMLMRATRCDRRTIEVFWEDLWVRRRAYMGMRAFVAAREIRMGREAKAGIR